MPAHALWPELDDVRSRLPERTAEVLRRYCIEVKRPPRGDWYGHRCPLEYHRKSPRAFVINPESGRWQCFAGCGGRDGKALGGDLFTLIAEREGLSLTGEDFAHVVAIGADIAGVEAGVEMSPEERARRWRAHREDMERRRCEEQERKKREREAAIPIATARWLALATRGAPGEAYLWERGVLDVVARGLVRFDVDDRDSIALSLRTYDGKIVNVIRRRLPAWAPTRNDRFRPIDGLPATGTYVHTIAEIGPGRDVVLTEGAFDAITAALAWPEAVIIGARSASDLPKMARYAAPRVKRHGVRLLVVAHRDDAGFNAARAALDEARNAGLRLREHTLEIVKHPEADLNDSWRAGWRPSAWSTT